MIREGGCQCRAVRFRADGEGLAAYCHCRYCRKATGAPVSLWVGYDADAVSFVGSPATIATDAGVNRAFCRDCGTPLTYHDTNIDGPQLYLAVGAFDEPSTLRPVRHAFWRDRIVEVADDLPKFRAISAARTQGALPELD